MARTALTLVMWLVVSAPVLAEGPMAVNTATLKFTTPQGFPPCATIAPLRGDPTKEAAVLYAKTSSGCRIPWHWHTANEQLMIATGSGTLEMKDEKPLHLEPGAYAFLPGHHLHQFTCLTACTLFDISDGAFDSHYVNNAGNEIPAADALRRH